MHPLLPHLRNVLLAATALLVVAAAPAAAGPNGPSVVGGMATVQGAGSASVIVNQSTPSAIINWNTFNIGAHESVRFNQPSSSSVALNRVTGGLGPSEILGTLTANGRIFLINRDGILFGPGSVVNTAGFLATTNDIRNSDFMAGRYNFNIPGRPDASIVNQGRITATSGGFAALVAPGVRNSGTITATLGTVALASGNSFTLDMYGDKLITLAVGDEVAAKVRDVATGQPLKSLVTNDGKIRANGGRVELTAAAARTIVDSVINTRGVITANAIGRRNGMIVLAAATGASKGAGLPTQTVKISGKLLVAGRHKNTKGGTILVTGEDIKLANARLDASGRAGGGKVLIGGDWAGGHPDASLVNNASAQLEAFAIPTATTVSLDSSTVINASATERGNGGKVVLWSDSETTFAGTILARGGAKSGDGGFVETSSHHLLNYSGTSDTRAPKGTVGTLLLDPENYYVNASGLPPKSDPTASAISANALVAELDSNNVVLSTSPSGTNAGDIFVNAHVTWRTNNSLTLSAYHDILFMSGSNVTNTGAGNLVLRADNTGRGQGTVVFDSGGHVDYTQSTGTVSIFYNPSGSETTKYRNPTDYFCPPCAGGGGVFVNLTQPSQLTAYMLVNTASDLDAVRTNQSGTYALGTKITLDPNQTFTPIPNFTGLLDGQGQTIVNLTIVSTGQNVGLFGTIGSTGVVRNLNLADTTVSGLGSQFVGTLAGTNGGTISNVSATDVAVGVGSNGNGGGLVGLNSGTIANAFASGDVIGAAGTTGFTTLGGLAAVNFGSISNSSASVDVGSPNIANLQAGGLVGNNTGTILSSFATGNVQAGDESIAAGLVSSNSVSGTITGSQASGNVIVASVSVAGGLVGASAGTITDSTASGAVTSTGANSTIGGLVGASTGAVTDSAASGAISGAGANSTIGGLIGTSSGTITDSTAAGTVTDTGTTSTLGGLVGANAGNITDSTASGAVTSTGANSNAGGLAGTSAGTITNSTASGTVISSGTNSATGGLVAANAGSITDSTASGAVSSFGANSTIGGLVATASVSSTITDSSASGAVSSTGVSSTVGGLAGTNAGTITDSTASGTVTSSGASSTVGGLVAANTGTITDSSTSGAVTSTGVNSTVGDFVGVNSGTIIGGPPSPPTPPPIGPTPPPIGPTTPLPPSREPQPTFPSTGVLASPVPLTPEFFASLSTQQTAQQAQVPQNLASTVQLAALSTAPVFNTVQGGILLPPQQPPSPAGQSPSPAPGAQRQLPSGFNQRILDVPPPTETRFIKDEVLMQIVGNITVERLQAAVANLGLTLLASENLAITGSIVARFHIDNGRTPAQIIRALAAIQLVAVAQPNYVYALQQESAVPAPAARGEAAQLGDAAQYILEKLKISDVHRIVKGDKVPIAVIDSEIDATHPDLEGAVAERFDAVGAPEMPHPHGTGMAGAIAAHRRLLGIAPGARLLAVHAFSSGTASPESTTFSILKGIDWSVKQDARIINMSFAGPRDPSLDRALKAAYDKGVVLIAAAGNAGPKSPPLFPGADQYVIAVTATDVKDKLFVGANRGKYISVAAPGVDILVPAPESSYQLTTGTSVAAAEVSGMVALLLERNPKLTPADIRRILTASAKRLAPGERNDNFGSGLVDPLKALQLAEPHTAATTPSPSVRPPAHQ